MWTLWSQVADHKDRLLLLGVHREDRHAEEAVYQDTGQHGCPLDPGALANAPCKWCVSPFENQQGQYARGTEGSTRGMHDTPTQSRTRLPPACDPLCMFLPMFFFCDQGSYYCCLAKIGATY